MKIARGWYGSASCAAEEARKLPEGDPKRAMTAEEKAKAAEKAKAQPEPPAPADD